jgi:hypothetical protein
MTTKNSSFTQDAELMARLREILLTDDRDELARLKTLIDTPSQLSVKIEPILEAKMADMKQHFPREYKNVVDKLIEDRIKSSQSEILDTIYPVLGLMIQKYINYQFQMLKDAIDKRIEETLGKKSIIAKLRMRVFGLKDSDILLSNLDRPLVHEVYVIQRDSGLLIGSASTQDTLDKDMVAGMLTAIKAFVEDAFIKEKQELELIKYGNFKILLQNYHSYYISVALSGSVSAKEQDELSQQMNQFSERELRGLPSEVDSELFKNVSAKLEHFFIEGDTQKDIIQIQ